MTDPKAPSQVLLLSRSSSDSPAREELGTTATEENDDEDEQLRSALDKITAELEIGKYL